MSIGKFFNKLINPINPLQLTTQRLVIRPFRYEDWPDLYEYLSDPIVVQYEPYTALTREQTKKEAASRAAGSDFWSVCLPEGKMIGNLYFSKRDFGAWELGYVFHRAYQGQGYASESAWALLDYAFLQLGVRRVIAECDVRNSASWRLMERLHMRREACFRQNIYFRQDEQGRPLWVDSYQYALLKDEFLNWKARKEQKEEPK